MNLYIIKEKVRNINPIRGFWCESYVCIAYDLIQALSFHPYLDDPNPALFEFEIVGIVSSGQVGLISKNYIFDRR